MLFCFDYKIKGLSCLLYNLNYGFYDLSYGFSACISRHHHKICN